MSWWHRLLGTSRAEEVDPGGRPDDGEPAGTPRALELLGSLEFSEREQLAALRELASGEHEQQALISIQQLGPGAGPGLRGAAAQVARARGQPDWALTLLGSPGTAGALLLAADIHEEMGDLPVAIAHVERALLSDVDLPGAWERHQRWTTRARGKQPPAPAHDGATLLGAEAPATDFTIVREAGRGGAGTVYRATDEGLDRTLAFKVYHRPERDRSKLLREARFAQKFAGPGVVRVFDVDLEMGWLALEWVEGGSLKAALSDAEVELLPLERWLVPLCESLARVHAAGFVHADLKPANVLLRSPGDPLLADFGICAPPGEVPLGGSLGYLSPERLDGKPLSAADDVYAAGRVVEDALAVYEDTLSREVARAWRRLADLALASQDERPADASVLLARFPTM